MAPFSTFSGMVEGDEPDGGGQEQNRHPPKHLSSTKGAVGKTVGFVRPVRQPVGAVRRRGRAARRCPTSGGAQGRGIRPRCRAGAAGWGCDGCMDSQSYLLSPFTGTDNVRSEKFPLFLAAVGSPLSSDWRSEVRHQERLPDSGADAGGRPCTRTGVKRNHRQSGAGGDYAPAAFFIQMRAVLRGVWRGTTHRIGDHWPTPPGRSPQAHTRGPWDATLM